MPQPDSPGTKPARTGGAKSAETAKSASKAADGGSGARKAKAAARKPASTLGRTARRTSPAKQPVPAGEAATGTGRHEASPSGKELAAHIDRVWALAKHIGICMFITWDGERQRARPLVASLDKDNHAIWFLTDVHAHKDEQVEKFPIVALAFADNGGSRYVSITGRAEVLDDRAMVRKLWSPFAKAWWKDADDPAIRLIKVTPEDAELWDSQGGLFSRVAMLAAAVTGRGPRIGDNAKVTL